MSATPICVLAQGLYYTLTTCYCSNQSAMNNDYRCFQDDVSAIHNLVTGHYLRFNTAKCKTTGLPGIIIALPHDFLHWSWLFKYLGLILSSDQQQSRHTEHIATKAHKLVGLMYTETFIAILTRTLWDTFTSLWFALILNMPVQSESLKKFTSLHAKFVAKLGYPL